MKAILLFKTQKFFLREFRVLLISFELSDKFGVNRSIYDSERTNLEVRWFDRTRKFDSLNQNRTRSVPK